MKDFEAFERHWTKDYTIPFGHCGLMAAKEAFKAGYEAAQPKWLPIESAPDDKDIQLAILNYTRKQYYTKVGWKSLNPNATLWQPLAEPPES